MTGPEIEARMRAELPDALVAKYDDYDWTVYLSLPSGLKWRKHWASLCQPHDLENFIQEVKRAQRR